MQRRTSSPVKPACCNSRIFVSSKAHSDEGGGSSNRSKSDCHNTTIRAITRAIAAPEITEIALLGRIETESGMTGAHPVTSALHWSWKPRVLGSIAERILGSPGSGSNSIPRSSSIFLPLWWGSYGIKPCLITYQNREPEPLRVRAALIPK